MYTAPAPVGTVWVSCIWLWSALMQEAFLIGLHFPKNTGLADDFASLGLPGYPCPSWGGGPCDRGIGGISARGRVALLSMPHSNSRGTWRESL